MSLLEVARDLELPSAKRERDRLDFFSYYAGFSTGFVEYCLRHFADVSENTLVLDPWNGSGTTTTAAAQLGFEAVGYDLNPVMVVVARARLTPRSHRHKIQKRAERIAALVANNNFYGTRSNEPLQRWFYPSSAMILRRIANELGVRSNIDGSIALSEMDHVLVVALFKTTKAFLNKFQTTNPTWLSRPVTPSSRIRASSSYIAEQFLRHAIELSASLKCSTEVAERASIELQDAREAHAERRDIGLVLGSPPYCTRIDYAVATRPELAVLGLSDEDFVKLRRSLSGSTSNPDNQKTSWKDPDLGLEVNEALSAIENHPSHGSANYYLPNIGSYFRDAAKTVGAISSSLRIGGKAILVVQDSFYKELRLPVQEAYQHAGARVGLELVLRADETIRSPKSLINTHSRKYRTVHSAIESTLVFRKGVRHANEGASEPENSR